MLFGMTYYQICWYFLIYSFLGWVVEVAFHAVSLGKVVNRGFLNGPVCPIYGFGVLSVFSMINSCEISGIEMNDFLIFVVGVILATLVELIGGWLLDKCFHARWWDYSMRPFNFHGYICLEFSIVWGLAILLVIKVFQKYVEAKPTFFVESNIGWIILAILFLIYLADLIVTVAIINGFNKKLENLDQIRKEMRIVSDKLSEGIANRTIGKAQKVGENAVQLSLAKAEFKDSALEKREHIEIELCQKQEELKARFDDISSSVSNKTLFGSGRLLKAFPYMKHNTHQDIVDIIKRKNMSGENK